MFQRKMDVWLEMMMGDLSEDDELAAALYATSLHDDVRPKKTNKQTIRVKKAKNKIPGTVTARPTKNVLTAAENSHVDRRKLTAEEAAYEAMSADMSEWIVYDPGQDLDCWLEDNRPSVVSREDHIGWITIETQLQEGVVEGDLARLHREWAAMVEKSRNHESVNEKLDGLEADYKIDFHSICQLARNCRILSGKWLFHAPTGYKVDILWRKVCEEMVGTGVLADVATSAKVSPVDGSAGSKGTHVICVYGRDYSDFDEVCRLEAALRAAGVLKELKFKPDVYTYLRIYVNNEWGIRPTIYTSLYDVLTKKSKVTRLHDTTPEESSSAVKRW